MVYGWSGLKDGSGMPPIVQPNIKKKKKCFFGIFGADVHTFLMVLIFFFQQLASHGLFDVHVRATGDIHIDDHHTNEDVALAIGTVSFQILCHSMILILHFVCLD